MKQFITIYDRLNEYRFGTWKLWYVQHSAKIVSIFICSASIFPLLYGRNLDDLAVHTYWIDEGGGLPTFHYEFRSTSSRNCPKSLASEWSGIVMARLMVSSANFRTHLKKLMFASCRVKPEMNVRVGLEIW